MPLKGNMIRPLDEVLGEQRPLDPELYRLAGVLSALPDQSGVNRGFRLRFGVMGWAASPSSVTLPIPQRSPNGSRS